MLIRRHAIDHTAASRNKYKQAIFPLKQAIERLSQNREEAVNHNRYELSRVYNYKLKQKQEELYSLQTELRKKQTVLYNTQKYYEKGRCTKFNFKNWQYGKDAIKTIYDKEGNLQTNPRQF